MGCSQAVATSGIMKTRDGLFCVAATEDLNSAERRSVWITSPSGPGVPSSPQPVWPERPLGISSIEEKQIPDQK